MCSLLPLAFLLLVSAAINAQSLNQSLHELHHTSWSEKEGLYGGVTGFAQTPDGFLWLATTSGLFRFDGITFEAYKAASGSLPNGAPTRLRSTPEGGLWLSYEGGRIAYLKDGVAKTYTEKEGYPYGPTKDIVRTRDGSIWAAVVGGLARFDGTSWKKVRADWSYNHTAAQCLFVDRQDTLWVCSGTDVTYLPSGAHQFHDLGFSFRRLVMIRQARDGMMWLSDAETDTVSPFRSPLEPQSPGPMPPSVPIGSWAILFPADGSFWFGTEQGVRRLPSTSAISPATSQIAEKFDKEDGVSDHLVSQLFEDREGNIWAGTSGGVDRFRKRKLSFISTGKSPHIVSTDSGDTLAVYSTDLPPELLPARTPVPDLPSSLRLLYGASRSPDGSVWFLGSKQTSRWKSGKLEDFPYPKYDLNSRIYALSTDHAGTVWASISGLGLMKFMAGAWTHLLVLPGEPDIAPRSVEADDHEQIWLAYDARQRVACIKDGAVSHIFGPEDGLAVGLVRSVMPAGQDVWVAGDGGLALLRGNRFVTVTNDDGAALPAVRHVASTRDDGLWLSTGKGIAHVFKTDLQSYLDRHSKGLKYEILDTASDLPEPLAASAAITPSSPVPGRKGQLWFTTIAGVANIDLTHIERNTIIPPVVITGLTTDRQSFPPHTSVTLPPKTRSFTIAYTALSLTNASRNRFKVRLDGWDKQWQDPGSRREATYSNLGPGTYIFHVIACNNDGLWNETGAALTIKVLPAFYQTLWFRLLCLALLTLLAWAFYTWRVKRLIQRSNDLLLERLAERERIAHDLHDTFLQSVQGLLLRFHSATGQLAKGDATRTLLEETLNQSDRVMLEGRGLVLDLHTSAYAAGEILHELRSIGDEYLAYNPLSFSVASVGSARPLSAIISNELRSFGREALSNAFRHSDAEKIQVEVRYEPRQLVVTFRDDGRGIDSNILEAGQRVGHWGLQGMRERAKRMGACLSLKSSATSGTEIELLIPAAIAYSENPRRTLRQLFRRN